MLENKIKEYKKKYYLNSLLKGGILTLSSILLLFYLINTVEYFGELNQTLRAFLFYTFILGAIAAVYQWIASPLIHLLSDKKMSDKEAALQIGEKFPNIKDKLLNLLQLKYLSNNSSLAEAGIMQKAATFENVKFSSAIKYEQNRRYLKYLLIPLFFIIITLGISPQIFTESTPRIINYNEARKAPFEFIILNKKLQTFKNEDFTLSVKTKGIAVPKNIRIVTSKGRTLKMQKTKDGFSHTFKNVLRDINFQLEGAGFNSDAHKIDVYSRPTLIGFTAYVEYPKYIHKKNERIDNAGNFTIPQGTKIKWQFKTKNTADLKVHFNSATTENQSNTKSDDTFEFSKTILKSDSYQILMKNEFSGNKDIIEYNINVISDQFPGISMQQYQDTVLYNNLIVGGNITDDYGITGLYLYQRRIKEDSTSSKFQRIKVTYNRNLVNQSFFHRLDISEMGIQAGEKLEFYMEVWDNDGINGRKRTKTRTFNFKIPTKKEIKEKIKDENQKTENQINKTLNQAKDFKKELKDIKDKLKGKKKLEWQDKKKLKELKEKHDKLEKEINKLKELNKLLNKKQEKFSEENDAIKKKSEQLQKLMEEILDDKTKELYEQLDELLDQNLVNKDLQELLEKMDMKQENVENELDRAIELFKKLKFEKKANEIINDLKELSEKQDKLSDQTKDAKKKDLAELEKKQEDLNRDFDDIKKEMEELDKLNQDTESPKDLNQLEQEKKEIGEEQEKSLDNIKEGKKKKASESQKKSSKKMKKMVQQMEQMMESMEMEQMNENYDDLRMILENLITLSFEQERLMVEFKRIRRIDPKFVRLGQEQLKLKDDSKIIEDSLISLSKRVFQIESFVTREVKEMNKYMDESTDAIKRRIPHLASGKQQFAMTSINNLALLINDILKQMQQQMSSSMSGKQMSEKKGNSPSLSQLQKQLNKQIQNLKKSGKSGKQLSEALAKLAAQQEAIRRAMQKGMGNGSGSGGENGKPKKGGEKGKDGKGGKKKGDGTGEDGGNYAKLLKEMEKTEADLVNKKITTQTLKRQKEILTRLLESEKAQKERELDKKREAKTAKQELKKNKPSDFSEYLKIKELQIELLKTIPTSLNPYYKKEVNEYFKKVKK